MIYKGWFFMYDAPPAYIHVNVTPLVLLYPCFLALTDKAGCGKRFFVVLNLFIINTCTVQSYS